MGLMRKRTSLACENCRKRKIKCSGGPVCQECARFGSRCFVRSQYRATKKSIARAQSRGIKYVLRLQLYKKIKVYTNNQGHL